MSYSVRVSVIIPAYNATGFITRAIQSAQAQTAPPLEVIVIDDGSTDTTAQVVEDYAKQQGVDCSDAQCIVPVRLLRQTNGGPAAARNHGAREAKGEWLAFLDADDTYLPHKLEKQIPYTSDSNVAVVHGGHVPLSEPITFETLWRRNQVVNSTTLVRKAAFEQLGGFDEDRALIGVEDYNLWLRLARQNWKFADCPEKLVVYTRGEGCLSLQVERFARAELVNVQKLATAFQLTHPIVEQKQLAVLDEYGRMATHTRQMVTARRLLADGLRRRPTLKRLHCFVAACLPASLLDFRLSRHRSRNLAAGGGE